MKKHLFLFLLLSLSLGFTNKVSDDPNKIPWNSSRKINWDDFLAKPDKKSEFEAETEYEVAYGFSYKSGVFAYEVNCHFDKTTSWVKNRSEYLLIHEQGHFDLAEICARKIRKLFKAYKFNAANAEKDLDRMYEQQVAALNKEQELYDTQTKHSVNEKQQELWNKKIEKQLSDLSEFTKP